MKKLRQAGKLGAGRTVVVSGIGGLGSYAVQYARLLGGGATVVAFARSDEKLALAKENGAITPSTLAVRPRKRFGMPWRTLRAGVTLTRSSTAPEPKTAWRLAQRYWPERALTCVGLMGQKVVLPLLPFTNGEKSYFGSFWGNYDDLAEVLRLRARDSSSTPLPRWPSTTSTTSWRNWRGATSWAAPSWSSTEPLASGTDIPAVLSPTADCSTGCGGWGVGVLGCGGGCG
ncbi:MAG: zinc-binding dehydrogenase [Mycobacterium sp.]